jgi:hypothetical protein
VNARRARRYRDHPWTGCAERASLARRGDHVRRARLTDTDAVCVELEHRDGHAVEVYLPYRKKRLLRGVDYGDLSAASGAKQIW